jgi:hypothetical protein
VLVLLSLLGRLSLLYRGSSWIVIEVVIAVRVVTLPTAADGALGKHQRLAALATDLYLGHVFFPVWGLEKNP